MKTLRGCPVLREFTPRLRAEFRRSSDGLLLAKVCHWVKAALYELGRWGMTQSTRTSQHREGHHA